MSRKNSKNFDLKIVRTPYAEDENAHVFRSVSEEDAKKLKKFNTEYNYVKRGAVFRFFSYALMLFAMPVLNLICRPLYGLRVEGRKNFKKVKKSGSVICCSHNLGLDCAIVQAAVTRPKPMRFLAAPMAFTIPFVRHLARLLRGVPVPESIKAIGVLQREMIDALKAGETFLIFPESSNWHYYHKLRNFKKGAFTIAIKAGVPVVPVTLAYRAPNKFYRFFGRKAPLITAVVGEPIYPEGKTAEVLSAETFAVMEKDFYRFLDLGVYGKNP